MRKLAVIVMIGLGAAWAASGPDFRAMAQSVEVDGTEPSPARGPVGGLEELQRSLERRERALEMREQRLEDREEELEELWEQLEARMANLDDLRGEVRELVRELDERQEAEVQGLVEIVSSMRPRDAGPVVAALDGELAVEVLGRMSANKAGQLLAAIPADQAAWIAERLSERANVALSFEEEP